MTEVSYIVQNGQKVYFKDTAGRELLTQKQVKLKAGRGISIAEDGTISTTGGNGSANGFFINASGELNNLTFDKTPVELNTAIENEKLYELDIKKLESNVGTRVGLIIENMMQHNF